MSSPVLVQQLAGFLTERLDVKIVPFVDGNGMGQALKAALDSSPGAGTMPELKPASAPLCAVIEKRLAQTFSDRAFCRRLAQGLHRHRIEAVQGEKLLFWMNTPFTANDLDLARCRRPSLAPFIDDFARHIDISGKDISMCDLHTRVVEEFCFSLVSDRAAVFETDFTHDLNMVLKYIIRPFDAEPVVLPTIRKIDELFISEPFERNIASGVFFGTTNDLGAIFTGHISRLNDQMHHYFHNRHDKYLYFVVSEKSYEMIYLFPLYAEINISSPTMRDALQLSKTARLILTREGSLRLSVNLQRVNMRHTICVQVEGLNKRFSNVFKQSGRILENFSGDKHALNIDMSKANQAINKIFQDIERQLGNEFDAYGNRLDGDDQREESMEKTFTTNDLVRLLRTEVEAARLGADALVKIESLGDGATSLKQPGKVFNSFREFFTNAMKYNVGGAPVSVIIDPSGNSILVTVSNIGPALTREEENAIPTLGFRGIGAQKLTSRGSGQGLAGAFATLEDLDIERKYRQTPLDDESLRRRRLRGQGALATHLIEVRLPPAQEGRGS